MEKITVPAKCYTEMKSPFDNDNRLCKARFFVRLSDVPHALTNWMSTNPREQKLTSPVAKAIAASIGEDSRDFHIKNRGILLAAKTIHFTPSKKTDGEGIVTITFDHENLHGNVDGGHTLRLILESQANKNLPEQYVEFEVLVGIENIIPVAEARNTSVALDMKSMEEMRGSFDILKEVYGDMEINGDQFFRRVELKMNQQLEIANHIDIRTLISIILMFNQNLFPTQGQQNILEEPTQMYGSPEKALNKYLELGDGDSSKRNAEIRKMFPILKDIVVLWDTIERELPLINAKKYGRLPFAQKRKEPRAMFSNTPMEYTVPQAIIFPIAAAFRFLVDVDESGLYSWAQNPITSWEKLKNFLFTTFLNSMETARNNPNTYARKKPYWSYYSSTVRLYRVNPQSDSWK